MSPPWHNPQTVGLVHTVRLGSAISFPIDLQHKQPRNILQREKQKWRNNGSLLSEKQIHPKGKRGLFYLQYNDLSVFSWSYKIFNSHFYFLLSIIRASIASCFHNQVQRVCCKLTIEFRRERKTAICILLTIINII